MKIKKKIGQLTEQEYYDLRHLISSMELEFEVNSSKQILTGKEIAYLKALIEPFKDRVLYIKKCLTYNNEYFYINIAVNSIIPNANDYMILPTFRNYESFEGMEKDHKYTLEELCL